MSIYKKEIKDRKEHFRVSLWENLLGLKHSKVEGWNFSKQRAKVMIKLNRNRLRVLTIFLQGIVTLGKT